MCKKCVKIAGELFPHLNDEEIGSLLLNATGFPTVPVEVVRKQLQDLKDNTDGSLGQCIARCESQLMEECKQAAKENPMQLMNDPRKSVDYKFDATMLIKLFPYERPPSGELWLWKAKKGSGTSGTLIGFIEDAQLVRDGDGLLFDVDNWEPVHPYIDPKNPITLDKVPLNEEVEWGSRVYRAEEEIDGGKVTVTRFTTGGREVGVAPHAIRVFGRPNARLPRRQLPRILRELPRHIYALCYNIPVCWDSDSSQAYLPHRVKSAFLGHNAIDVGGDGNPIILGEYRGMGINETETPS